LLIVERLFDEGTNQAPERLWLVIDEQPLCGLDVCVASNSCANMSRSIGHFHSYDRGIAAGLAAITAFKPPHRGQTGRNLHAVKA
jgi:hypothetical protein